MPFLGTHHFNNDKLMIKRIFGTLCTVVLCLNICIAQSNNSQTATNWGMKVQGVQLSIAISNNIIDIGATIVMSAQIRNLSTNIIHMVETGPVTDFDVLLTNNSGKFYKLTPKQLINTYRFPVDLNPGESRDWVMPVTIGKDIELGNYTLKATRPFYIGKSGFELESNLLNVQIK
jgi:hypothetical protein